jgi:NAD(P)H-dependent flavin oxidoreductase YrpB (nitropropane dioxygenase family)
VWTGSIWLTAAEAHTSGPIKSKLLAATSADTVRSKAISGKPARQLRTAWSDAWDDPNGPGPLPMPLQFMLTAEAVGRIHRHAEDVDQATPLLTSPVGQIVGTMNEIRPAGELASSIAEDCRATVARLTELCGR